jgi:hypothetical protein
MAKVIASPAKHVAGARRRPKVASAPVVSLRASGSMSKDVIEFNALEELPLNDEWVLWFDRYIGPGFSAEEYAAAVKEVCSFHSVQGFWCWYNNLPPASSLDPSCTYHLMKKGIKPLWEDEGNVNGGNLAIKIPRHEVDHAWTHLSLAAIGGELEDCLTKEDGLCGISLGMRKSDAAIHLWNADALHFDIQSAMVNVTRIITPEQDLTQSGLWADAVVSKAISDSVAANSVYKVHKSLTNFGNNTVARSPSKRVPEVSPSRRNALKRR